MPTSCFQQHEKQFQPWALTRHHFHLNDSALLAVKKKVQSGWQSLASAAELVQSYWLHHQWFPLLCGRGSSETIATAVGSFPASALLPPGSRGITCLSAPLCWVRLPRIALLWQLWFGSRESRSKSSRNELVLQVCIYQCTAASIEETVGALIALLLPDERRRVSRSNTSTDVKAISAFSVTGTW